MSFNLALYTGYVRPITAVHGILYSIYFINAAVNHCRNDILVVVNHETGVGTHLITDEPPNPFRQVGRIAQDNKRVLKSWDDPFQKYLCQLIGNF